jgi:hypothetical protein
MSFRQGVRTPVSQQSFPTKALSASSNVPDAAAPRFQ